MRVTREMIEEWFNEAKQEGATHLIVMLDDFSSEYYPKIFRSKEEVQKRFRLGLKGMQRPIEVYKTSEPFDRQYTNAGRTVNF